ncbi:MAG: adenosine deaminase [Suipraeoptans sp.]
MISKIDLHCHLDGSLSKEFMEDILGREVALSEIQVGDVNNLAEYLEKFNLPLECIQTEENLTKAGYDFIRTVAGDEIRYVEVRFAPLLSANENLNTEKIIIAVLKGLKKGKDDFGVDSNIITCAMRHHSEEDNLKMLKTARSFLGEGVCAADLAGDEAGFPMSNFMNLYNKVRSMDMPFTIHAGETGNSTNIIDAIDIGARRIGHGVAMTGHPDVQEVCKIKRIGVEMCPISNLQTHAIPDMNKYPMREFLDNGLPVTINTDNRTVSNTSITKEIEYAINELGITSKDINTMMQTAVDVSFADDTIKDRLLKV